MPDTSSWEQLTDRVKQGKKILQDFNWGYGLKGWKKDKEDEYDTKSIYKTYFKPDGKNIVGLKKVIYIFFMCSLSVKITESSDDFDSSVIKCKENLFGKITGFKLDITVRLNQHTNQITVYYIISINILQKFAQQSLKILPKGIVKTKICEKIKEFEKIIGFGKDSDEDPSSDSDKLDFGFAIIKPEIFNKLDPQFADALISLLKLVRTLLKLLYTFLIYMIPFNMDKVISSYLSEEPDKPRLLLLSECRQILNRCTKEIAQSYALVEQEHVKIEKLINEKKVYKTVNQISSAFMEKEHIKTEKTVIEREAEKNTDVHIEREVEKNTDVHIEREIEETTDVHREKGFFKSIQTLFKKGTEVDKDRDREIERIKLR
ncbi:MAG: hypothetical protein K2N87_08000 [Eubacterium sp.]|nr:hypothetical protein [Eubacterium sp.]